jgi:hypothetical protein
MCPNSPNLEWQMLSSLIHVVVTSKYIHCFSPSCASAPPFALVFTPVPHLLDLHCSIMMMTTLIRVMHINATEEKTKCYAVENTLSASL